MPATSSLDKALQAAEDLITALNTPAPASPFLNFGHEQKNALQQLAALFKVSLQAPPTSSLPRVDTIPSLPRVDTKPSPP